METFRCRKEEFDNVGKLQNIFIQPFSTVFGVCQCPAVFILYTDSWKCVSLYLWTLFYHLIIFYPQQTFIVWCLFFVCYFEFLSPIPVTTDLKSQFNHTLINCKSPFAATRQQLKTSSPNLWYRNISTHGGLQAHNCVFNGINKQMQ